MAGKADNAKLKRLQRLEKLRAIAKRNAAAETARAEGTLAQLQSLAGRSRAIVDTYRTRRSPATGAELRELSLFVGNLSEVVTKTESDAAKARKLADRKLSELAEAERRRSAVEERVIATQTMLARTDQNPATAARPRIGTGLE